MLVTRTIQWNILLDSGELIAILSVVGIKDNDITLNHLKYKFRKFMDILEANIGNTNQSLYDIIQPENIHYAALNDDPDEDDAVLSYSQSINNQNT